MGLRSNRHADNFRKGKGQTAATQATGKRLRHNVRSVVTSRGLPIVVGLPGTSHWQAFLRFLRWILRHAPGRLFLIRDRDPINPVAEIAQWMVQQPDRRRLCSSPSYSPDLNPTELLNSDAKADTFGRRPPRGEDAIIPFAQ